MSIIFHLPYIGISFFYAVNGHSYSEDRATTKKQALAFLCLVNFFMFSYPVFNGFYVLPSIILFIVPTVFFAIGAYKPPKPLLSWLLSTLYIINIALFALGGNKNYSGFGPKSGLYKSYYDSDSKILKSTENYSFGYRNGDYKEFHKNGQLAALIYFKDDTIVGVVKEYYDNGQLKISSSYVKNEVHGSYSSYYKSGKLESELTFKNGLLNGVGKVYYENGIVSSHFNYKNGKRHGDCKEYYPSGLLQSFFVYGNRPKECKSYYPNGQIKIKGFCLGEKKEGLWESYYKDGTLSASGYYISVPYNPSVKHGPWKTYYPNGQLETSGEYNKGIRNGEWVKYFESGKESDRRTY